MNRLARVFVVLCAAVFVAGAVADAAVVSVKLGTRETGGGGAIGSDGGSSGSLEWVGAGVNVPFDGAWHLVTFDLLNDPVAAFTGDGVLTGAAGTIEHLRIDAVDFAGPITVYLDEIAQTIDGAKTVISDFEVAENAAIVPGAEIMFRQPSFSGSTTGNLTGTPNITQVSSTEFFSGAQSLSSSFSFVDTESRWLRLTTFGGAVYPNPTINYGGTTDNTVTVAMKVVPEPATFGLLGLGGLALLRRRRR